MLNSKLESCSKEVQLGIKWLEETARDKGLSKGYSCSDAQTFYALMKVDSPLLKDFFASAENDDFWDPSYLFDDPHLLWYLAKIGLSSNNYFSEALDETKACWPFKSSYTFRAEFRMFEDSNQIFFGTATRL